MAYGTNNNTEGPWTKAGALFGFVCAVTAVIGLYVALTSPNTTERSGPTGIVSTATPALSANPQRVTTNQPQSFSYQPGSTNSDPGMTLEQGEQKYGPGAPLPGPGHEGDLSRDLQKIALHQWGADGSK